jgi:hypothetical protein
MDVDDKVCARHKGAPARLPGGGRERHARIGGSSRNGA